MSKAKEAAAAATEVELSKITTLLQSDFVLVPDIGNEEKTVRLSWDHGATDDLSEHRLQLIADTARRIYTQAGYSVVLAEDIADPDAEELHWHLTVNSAPQESAQPLQRRVVCGVVRNLATKRREKTLTAQQYISMREGDMTVSNGSPAVGAAVAQLELLHVSHVSCVSLDLTPGPLPNRGASNKGAAFFLYNYARVSTILRRHREMVCAKKYPSLPPVQSVAHLLLAEHELVRSCLEAYRTLLASLQGCLGVQQFPPVHQLCRFLAAMCRPLSRFYRTHHVLTEARPQLLPVMHARLHLLSAIQRVMERALGLLGISPPQHM